MKLSASNDISMIFQGTVEERNSKFPHFKTLLSFTCLDTNALNIYSLLLNFIILPFTADTAKELPPEKKATERFRVFPVTSQCLFGYINGFYQQTKIFIYELMRFMWLAASWQLYFLRSTIVTSRARKTEEKILTMECPFLKRGRVAVYLRSLRIIAAEEKNIPGHSRELMKSK